MSASGFITRCACRGRRPSVLSSCVVVSRPTLIAQLLKNRDAARFIVAPSGYGKSYLALEYAETMLSWLHTFWVNAQSPCFVREIDNGMLASYVLEADSEAALVVFDDLPLLDDARQEQLSHEIDTLLSEGCEVIVTCVPTCDLAGSLQPDRLRLGAASLLLSDSELDEKRTADERSRKPADQVGPAWRVPQLVWSREKEGGEIFAKRAMEEELPADYLLAVGSALVLQKGSLSDLSTFGSFDQRDLAEMADDYPHFGFDLDANRFEAPLLQVKEMASTMRTVSKRLVARSSFSSAGELICAWADMLLAQGSGSRSCEVIQEICPQGQRANWVLSNAAELVRQACFFPLFRLVVSLSDATGVTRMRREALEAFCRRLLGDEEGAVQFAKKGAFNGKAPEDAHVLGLLVVADADIAALSQQAEKSLAGIALAAEGKKAADCSYWELLARAWCERSQGPAGLSRLWERYHDEGASDDVLCICASWLFGLYHAADWASCQEGSQACRHVERYICSRLANDAQDNREDFYLASAGLALEEAHVRGYALENGALETATLVMLSRAEMGLLAQRKRFEKETQEAQVRRETWLTTHPDSLSHMGATGGFDLPERSVPILELRMFGCFEASIGGVPLEYSRFRRQNTRALLVLLAVNQGKELSRDAISQTMWPRSTPAVAAKNFYSVWSHLRAALSLPDGTCPYLVRHRFGCSLDQRLVHSDVERFSTICRELQFGSPNVDQWSQLFSEIDRDFSGDLMPAESDNGLIAKARSDYRTRLVDALVSATLSILDAGIPQWGVWFARAAVNRDDTREDAYVALMRAQIAGEQRTAAMMTYLKCRRVLAEKLGIDPSPETTALYESLLDSD